MSVGSVQEVDGYFSTSGVECAVVIEELRGHGLVYEFLNYAIAAFSFSLPLKRSSLSATSSLFSSISGTSAATTMENVAVFDSPGKGRGLKATKEFWAGDVIFAEPSVAAVVFDRYDDDGNCGCGHSLLEDVVITGIFQQLNNILNVISLSRLTIYP